MLGDADATVVLAVKDLDEAQKFYGDVLGLKKGKEVAGGVSFLSGKTNLYVYESEFAGTNKATAAGWSVSNFEEVVEGLKGKGVTFEQYDTLPGVTRDGDIHSWGDFKSVWFKDPTGNILAIDSGAL